MYLYVGQIAEQDYSAYPYASPLRGLREKLFLTIFSAPAGIKIRTINNGETCETNHRHR